MRQTIDSSEIPLVVAGIDVGGDKKGFHAVALADGAFLATFASQSAEELADWCRSIQAQVVAVDAPCRWSRDGRARPAERQLMREKIWCFSTPTPALARTHPTNYYGWMLRGEALFKQLEQTHELSSSVPLTNGKRYCFETFPHAITVSLGPAPISAKWKRKQRRQVLEQAGIDTTMMKNIDSLDAGLCALTAHFAATSQACVAYGEPHTGLIIVPKTPT